MLKAESKVLPLMYKLIAADIDGTLLDSARVLRPATENAIRRAREAGVLFTLSTGRPIQGIRKFRHLLSPDVPVITYNGSMVLTADTGRIILSDRLPEDAARTVWREGCARGTTVVAWADNRLYCNRVSEIVLDYRTLTMETPNEIADFEPIAGHVTKMIWLDDAETVVRYRAELGTSLGDGVRFTTSNPRYLEFMNSRVSKSAALRAVADALGFAREEIIAIGDGLNDLDMIEAAGMGVAMGNAHPRVLAAADFVTKTNDEDGLAYMIEELILR